MWGQHPEKCIQLHRPEVKNLTKLTKSFCIMIYCSQSLYKESSYTINDQNQNDLSNDSKRMIVYIVQVYSHISMQSYTLSYANKAHRGKRMIVNPCNKADHTPHK